jgi:hypothetical protein
MIRQKSYQYHILDSTTRDYRFEGKSTVRIIVNATLNRTITCPSLLPMRVFLMNRTVVFCVGLQHSGEQSLYLTIPETSEGDRGCRGTMNWGIAPSRKWFTSHVGPTYRVEIHCSEASPSDQRAAAGFGFGQTVRTDFVRSSAKKVRPLFNAAGRPCA